MTKRELLDNPNSCLNKAADDEPVFLLRAQDIWAPEAIKYWASLAKNTIGMDKFKESIGCAFMMESWPNRKMPT